MPITPLYFSVCFSTKKSKNFYLTLINISVDFNVYDRYKKGVIITLPEVNLPVPNVLQPQVQIPILAFSYFMSKRSEKTWKIFIFEVGNYSRFDIFSWQHFILFCACVA